LGFGRSLEQEAEYGWTNGSGAADATRDHENQDLRRPGNSSQLSRRTRDKPAVIMIAERLSEEIASVV
jgi:hypothetical protein